MPIPPALIRGRDSFFSIDQQESGFIAEPVTVLLGGNKGNMTSTENINYQRIAEAIEYLQSNFKLQPGLNEVAEKVHLSPFHFQRIFKEWAGVSPKQFLHYLTVDHAKAMLKDRMSLSEAAFETGLSGTGRLHDMFIKIEGMTPGEFKNGGEQLQINYSYAESPFGNIFIASTAKGICYMSFTTDEQEAFRELKGLFPRAEFRSFFDLLQQNALYVFTKDWSKLDEVKLHIKGTAFQLKVWEALLRVPMGGLITYSGLAEHVDSPHASRAVGTAVGSNPIAFLIPCHRVIRTTGIVGDYRWNSTRKKAIIGWEAARVFGE
jgi:AraC family transcriptional regulator, regulatory protein of adaptative response / methylated-DNA-[protein]-cysteine methyltransferase